MFSYKLLVSSFALLGLGGSFLVPTMLGPVRDQESGGGGVSWPLTATDDLLMSGNEVWLDTDNDSGMGSSGDEKVTVILGGTVYGTFTNGAFGALQLGGSGLATNNIAKKDSNITLQDLDYLELIGDVSATPAEPVACSVSTEGTKTYARDTDSGAGAECICIYDGSGYDWVRADINGTVCPFF